MHRIVDPALRESIRLRENDVEGVIDALNALPDQVAEVRSWVMFFSALLHDLKSEAEPARALYHELLKEADEYSNKLLLGAVNRAIGFRLRFTDPVESERHLKSASRNFAKVDCEHGVASISLFTGMLNYNASKYSDALVAFDTAQMQYETIDDKMRVAESLLWKGRVHTAHGDQDTAAESMADSLKIFQDADDKFGIVDALIALGSVSISRGDLDGALHLFEEGLNISREIDISDSIGLCLLNLGKVYAYRGELESALDHCERAKDEFEKSGSVRVAEAYSTIAIIDAELGKYSDALRYHLRAQEHFEANRQTLSTIISMLNVAIVFNYAADHEASLDWYERAWKLVQPDMDADLKLNLLANMMASSIELGQLERARELCDQAQELLKQPVSPFMKAFTLVTQARLFIEEGNVELARKLIRIVPTVMDVNERPDLKMTYLQVSARLHIEDSAFEKAIAEIEESISLAVSSGAQYEELRSREELLPLHRKMDDNKKFFEQYDAVESLRKKVAAESSQRKMALFSAEQEYRKERAETESMRRLLDNVLPEGIAERYLNGETLIADDIENVAVMFMDLVSFTNLASNIPPGHVVHFLNAVFKECDDVMREFRMTKIKTIGDAYLAVAGAPIADVGQQRIDNVKVAAKAAIELKNRLDNLEVDDFDSTAGNTEWTKHVGEVKVRFGLHVGTVVAGVVGKDRVAYDVWGDTVNVAARMEQNCEPGKIQVSDEFAMVLADGAEPEFDESKHVVLRTNKEILRLRGMIPIKGKGEIQTWWLEERELL